MRRDACCNGAYAKKIVANEAGRIDGRTLETEREFGIMSTNRVSPHAGRVEAARLPKGPNGRALCRNCGVEVPKGRRTFCGGSCADDWAVRNSPTLLRRRVFQRDRGICALCGIDSARLGRALQAEWQRLKLARTAPERRERAEFRKRYRWFFRRRSYWDADHIIPVIEGGGECTIENIRTLCVPCHQQVTKELARRRASRRRQQKGGRQRLVAIGMIEAGS